MIVSLAFDMFYNDSILRITGRLLERTVYIFIIGINPKLYFSPHSQNLPNTLVTQPLSSTVSGDTKCIGTEVRRLNAQK